MDNAELAKRLKKLYKEAEEASNFELVFKILTYADHRKISLN